MYFWLLNHTSALKLIKPACEAGRILVLGIFKSRTPYNDCSGEKDSEKRMDLRRKVATMHSKREREKREFVVVFCWWCLGFLGGECLFVWRLLLLFFLYGSVIPDERLW